MIKPKSNALPGWKALGGTSRKYQNLATGEIIGRRVYDEKVLGRISYEAKAKKNLAENPVEALARPAKGRKSIKKESPEVKAARKALIEEKKEIEKANKHAAKLSRIVTQKQKKQHGAHKINRGTLKAGHTVKRFAVSDYEAFAETLENAQNSGLVFGYSWGILGVDERNPSKVLTPTLSGSTLLDVFEIPDEGEYHETIEDYLSEVSYLIYIHTWIKLAFKSDYARTKAEKAGIKPKDYIGRHQR